MGLLKVLVEVDHTREAAFEAFSAALESSSEAYDQATEVLDAVAGLGVDLDESAAPVPMFSEPTDRPNGRDLMSALSEFGRSEANPDLGSVTTVVPVEVDRSRLEDLRGRPGVRVWPNSELTLYGRFDPLFGDESALQATESTVFDAARSRSALDCRPFRQAVEIETIRSLLGVETIWNKGFRGQNVTVGIIDEGVNGTVYPVAGGFA
ncbi:MAG: hypothetical protein M3O70_04525, partial [Actinomycetota bacterium]|nr:hypothetical protein [Actinomycetota bacterium]